jgi:hypothetical protein
MIRICEAEELEASLPRSMEGDGLSITEVRPDGSLMVSDGERAALYVPQQEKPLDGNIRIVPAYVEAGYFMQANVITLTDGERTATYVPKDREKLTCSRSARPA